VRFAPSDGIFSVDRRNALVSGSDDPSLAGGSSDYSSMPEPRKFQGSTPPALLKYIQLLNQPSANTPQAPFAPSDSPSPTGGLAGGSLPSRVSIPTIRTSRCRSPVGCSDFCSTPGVSLEGQNSVGLDVLVRHGPWSRRRSGTLSANIIANVMKSLGGAIRRGLIY
jgi:hypothetical protein